MYFMLNFNEFKLIFIEFLMEEFIEEFEYVLWMMTVVLIVVIERNPYCS